MLPLALSCVKPDHAGVQRFSVSSVRMQSTLVDVNAVAGGGKGTNPKTTLYVGGLEENVNEAILHSAFIPFGDIKDVNIPLDHATGAVDMVQILVSPGTTDLCKQSV